MDSAQPSRLTGPNNELAKERNRAAAERTITAWIQNCLTLIGFGIAIDQIGRALADRATTRQVLFDASYAPFFAMGFIILGIGLLIVALVQHTLEVSSIEQEDYVLLSINRLNQVVVSAIVAFGVVSAIAILLSLQG